MFDKRLSVKRKFAKNERDCDCSSKRSCVSWQPFVNVYAKCCDDVQGDHVSKTSFFNFTFYVEQMLLLVAQSGAKKLCNVLTLLIRF